MAASKAVWGIDLGQCALKAIRLRLAGDKVEAIDHVYIEHAKILSQPDAERPTLINEAMKKFIDGHDLTKEMLVVSVPGQNTLARFTKLPPVNKKKVPEIVKYEAQQQIPFDMEEVIWDYQTFEDAEAAETQVGIFAMRRELLRSHLAFLSNLNLEPAIVQSAPLALYNALKFDGIVGKEPIAILDIGAQNTDLIVVDGDSLWTRNIPIGGNNFTDALLKTFKLSFNKAERLKRDAQKHKYARQIFQAMRPVFADLVAEIQRSIGFFTSSRRGVKLNKVLAMGNAFQLPGMIKFVQQNLGMEVVRPASFNKLAVAEATNAAELNEQILSFGVAYGLALQGLGKAPITSNLLPTEIAKQVVWRRKTPWFYGAAACLLAAGALVWMRDFSDRGIVDKARAEAAVKHSFKTVYAPEDKEQKNPMPDPEAVRFVENGPNAASGLGKANQISAATQHLDMVVGQLETQYNDTLKQLEDLAKLQADKVVWPQILSMIDAAIPKVDPDLAKAMEDPEKLKALVKQNPDKYARGKRQQIIIERLDAQYSPDVVAQLQSIMKQAEGGKMVAPPPAGQPQKGFIIRLRARTPYQGKTGNEGGIFFVNNTFLANLRKQAMTANNKGAQAAYFDGVGQPLWQRQVKQWKPVSDSSTATPAANIQAGPGVADSEKDPVTGEPVNDTLFEIVFMAVLGEKPAAPAGGAAANPA